eukprot:GHVP01005338.1.p1 GENE.GHVP01005338.1~~GHVP01005338.1.p1  ORF type:complete len:148 (+),score=34.95 GHVP01005338.1:146-589(+)
MSAVFAMQGAGFLLSPLVMISLLKSNLSLEASWRILLGIGAFPSIVACILRWRMEEPAEFAKAIEGERNRFLRIKNSENEIGEFSNNLSEENSSSHSIPLDIELVQIREEGNKINIPETEFLEIYARQSTLESFKPHLKTIVATAGS